MSKLNVLIVTGMHRSGTSCLTDIITSMGLSSGPEEQLMAGNEFNPRGYFENTKIVEINDSILSDMLNSNTAMSTLPEGAPSRAWFELPPAGEMPRLSEALAVKMYKLVESIHERVAGQTIVLKDPRFCLTLQYWKDLLDIKGIVITVRNPCAVAQSLSKRDGFSHYQAAYLWAQYLKRLYEQISDLPYHIASYEALFETWERETTLLGEFLKDCLPQQQISEPINILDNSLNHFEVAATIDTNLYECLIEQRAFEQKCMKMLDDFAYEHLNFHAINTARQLTDANHDLKRMHAIIDRLNGHIISGSVIRIIRWLKKDKSFGSYTDRL